MGRPASARLLDEWERFPAGITRMDLLLEESHHDAPPGGAAVKGGGDASCHWVAFRIRKYLKETSPLDGANSDAANLKAKMDHAEFEVNQKLLPLLLAWIEDFRAVRITLSEAAEDDGLHTKLEGINPDLLATFGS